MKKKISIVGVVLGLVAGAVVALLAGSWIFWLATGIAIGVVLGSIGKRATRSSNFRSDANSRIANAGGANL